MTTTSRSKILWIFKQNTEITEWEKKILLGTGTDQEKIIDLHAHLEKMIINNQEEFEDADDFYNTLELAIQRNFDLSDLYEPRSNGLDL
jgi:hypothetical protein